MQSGSSDGELDGSDINKLSAVELKYKLQPFTYSMASGKAASALPPSTRSRQTRAAMPARTVPAMFRAARKRDADEDHAEPLATSPVPKKKRSTTRERSAADPHQVENNLTDSLRTDLMLIIIGLNPGLTTAATGHAYSHASNLFWKLLHWSGVTPVRHPPSDTHKLPDLYSIGNTNICERPTRSGDGLSKQELEEGAHILEEKIGHYKPEAVCIVGKGIWDTIYKVKTGKALKKGEFSYGWQSEELWLGRVIDSDGTILSRGSRTFVATTTSGLAAGMSTQEKIDVWTPLGSWVMDQRERIANGSTATAHDEASHIKVEADLPIVKMEDENV